MNVVRKMAAVVAVIEILSACNRARPTDPNDVGSLNLTCAPAPRGVHCRLLALFRDVSRAPRDVTADASWHLSGVAGARISADGVITVPADGDIELNAHYQSYGVQAWAQLSRDGPGHVLAALRGRVYVERHGTLRPVAAARVEVVSGPTAGLVVTTAHDGSYELVGLMPGDVVIRATKIGCTTAEGSMQIVPGVNRLSLLIELVPPTRASAL
jgi:hypothetical protein